MPEKLIRVQDSVLISSSGSPAFAASYSVNVYEVGADCVSNAAAVVTVRNGHGFAATDKLIKNDFDTGTYRTVNSVTATTLTLSAELTVANGDLLINLGPDTGGATPNYDGSGVTIYSDMDGTTAITDSELTTSAIGEFAYWVNNFAEVWELIRDATGAPVDLHIRTLPGGVVRATALPTVGVAGQKVILDGGAGVADITYEWVEFSDDTFDWREMGRAV